MTVETFLEPKDILIEGKAFIISKFPAIAGRKIVTQYLSSGIPKIGDYAVNEATMFEMMKYVAAVTENGTKIPLVTEALINNHVVSKISSWEMQLKLEKAMMEYNCSFFQDGRISNFFGDIAQKFQQLSTKTLKDLLALLSRQGSQPTKT